MGAEPAGRNFARGSHSGWREAIELWASSPTSCHPVPSAQLFAGAGLMGVRLVPLTAAFFAGRIVSYSLYVGAASAASKQLGHVLLGLAALPVGRGAPAADGCTARRPRPVRLGGVARFPPAGENHGRRREVLHARPVPWFGCGNPLPSECQCAK